MVTTLDMVQRYRNAEEAILEGQTVWWGGRRLGMPALAMCEKLGSWVVFVTGFVTAGGPTFPVVRPLAGRKHRSGTDG